MQHLVIPLNASSRLAPLLPRSPTMNNLHLSQNHTPTHSLRHYNFTTDITSTTLDRASPPRPSPFLHRRPGGLKCADQPTKSELPSSNSNRRNVSSHRQLHKPCMVEQSAKTSSPISCSRSIPHHATDVESPDPLPPSPDTSEGRYAFLHSNRYNTRKPSVQPMDLTTYNTFTFTTLGSQPNEYQCEVQGNRRRRGGHFESLIHRNNKSKQSSPYAVFEEGRQEVHLQVSFVSQEVFNRLFSSIQPRGIQNDKW